MKVQCLACKKMIPRPIWEMHVLKCPKVEELLRKQKTQNGQANRLY